MVLNLRTRQALKEKILGHNFRRLPPVFVSQVFFKSSTDKSDPIQGGDLLNEFPFFAENIRAEADG